MTKLLPKNTPRARKRRTREHVIAAQSANYVEGFLIDEGHTAERVANDYGYDLILFTYDSKGFVEPGHAFIQLKASDTLGRSARDHAYSFRVSIEDFHLWRHEPMPVFLVLFDATGRRAHWLYFQQYFEADARCAPRRGAKSVSVRVPMRNRINRSAIAYMRQRKALVLSQLHGVIKHDG